MLDEYNTILETAEAELIEKKSRFIATVRPVKSEDEARSFIAEMRKKYWDATHNVFAYQIGDRNEIQRSSDDGEPQGTAGKPVLDVLMGDDIKNTAVVVYKIFRRHPAWNGRSCARLRTVRETWDRGRRHSEGKAL